MNLVSRTKNLFLIIIVFTFISCNDEKVDKPADVSAPPSEQQDKKLIHLSTSANVKIISKYVDLIKQAYKKIGYEVKIHTLPAKRSLLESNEGLAIDGEVVRALFIKDMLPNQIRVPVMLDQVDVSAFSKDKSIRIQGWESLKGLSVSSILGFWYFSKQLKDRSVLTEVNDIHQALSSVKENKTKVCVLLKNVGAQMIQEEKYQDIKLLEPPIESIPVYHFINEKHAKIVPKLAQAINELTGNKIEN